MSLKAGAETIIDQCLQIQEDEEVIVLNDSNDRELFEALFEVLDERGIEYEYVEYEEPEKAGQEPPEDVARKMKQFDVFIAPTVKSISHTEAREAATEAGVRGATLPGITKQVWNQSLQADYDEVEKITKKAYEVFKHTDTIKVENENGTSLEIEVEGKVRTDDGKIGREGRCFGNLPAGEVFTAPSNVNGVLKFDTGLAEGSAKLKIEDGRVEEIIEGDEGSELVETIRNVENADNIAEFGFGTNPKARLVGTVIQDEKVLGTVHVALGDSSGFAEKEENSVESEIHWDSIVEEPTVWFDDIKMLEKGEPVFLED